MSLIESYFSEGKKLWNARKDFVTSRAFYEMWEKIVEPRPSYVTLGTEVDVFGTMHPVPEGESQKVGFYRWDGTRQLASLIFECDDWVMRFFFSFSPTGDPVVTGPVVDYPDDGELSHGERLEVVYDVLTHLYKKKHLSRQQLREISRDDFQNALREIRKYYEEQTYTTMRRLPHENILDLVNEALEDTPRNDMEDSDNEWGNESRNAKKEENTPAGLTSLDFEAATAKAPDAELFPVPSQTQWQILLQLRCVSEARKKVVKYEKVCKIPFTNVEIVGDDDLMNRGEYAIKIDCKNDLPLVESDVVTVFNIAGEQEGSLIVDLYDGAHLYGRIRFDDRNGLNRIDDTLWALPVPSSAGYLAQAMQDLEEQVRAGGKNISAATRAALGMDDVFQYHVKPENAPDILDADQARAWAESVDERNKVVLVQGPPGTGKTSVLGAVLRTMVERGLRLLVAAPSNAAVDNLIRRVLDLPVLRIARQRDYVSPDIAARFWEGELDNVRTFAERMKSAKGGCIFAGTQVSLMKNSIISDEIEARGLFDAVIFDEAGMTRIEELILCTDMAKRAVLFGDHRQLLPFPLPKVLMTELKREWGGMPRILSYMLERSALEWLCEGRGFPTILLRNSYRCQNPRLIRFSSTLFYNAAVRTSAKAEYYRLPERERLRLYPPSTLLLYNTSGLPPHWRSENIVFEGQKPGIENQLEAEMSAKVVDDLADRYPLSQITVIVPYRRQVRLIRRCLIRRREHSKLLQRVGKGEWDLFLSMRISTVDSFQGGESDAVVISYVRSNEEKGVGFVDEPNRINVAHTRCRRELVVIGDFECLKSGGGGRIFNRMERAFARDGKVVNLTREILSKSGIYIRPQHRFPMRPGQRTKPGFKFEHAGEQRPYQRGFLRDNTAAAAPSSAPRDPNAPASTQPRIRPPKLPPAPVPADLGDGAERITTPDIRKTRRKRNRKLHLKTSSWINRSRTPQAPKDFTADVIPVLDDLPEGVAPLTPVADAPERTPEEPRKSQPVPPRQKPAIPVWADDDDLIPVNTPVLEQITAPPTRNSTAWDANVIPLLDNDNLPVPKPEDTLYIPPPDKMIQIPLTARAVSGPMAVDSDDALLYAPVPSRPPRPAAPPRPSMPPRPPRPPMTPRPTPRPFTPPAPKPPPMVPRAPIPADKPSVPRVESPVNTEKTDRPQRLTRRQQIEALRAQRQAQSDAQPPAAENPIAAEPMRHEPPQTVNTPPNETYTGVVHRVMESKHRGRPARAVISTTILSPLEQGNTPIVVQKPQKMIQSEAVVPDTLRDRPESQDTPSESESNAAAQVKRSRGRPRKEVDPAAETVEKRPRGRPRNVVDEQAAAVEKKPRGRPKKDPNAEPSPGKKAAPKHSAFELEQLFADTIFNVARADTALKTKRQQKKTDKKD